MSRAMRAAAVVGLISVKANPAAFHTACQSSTTSARFAPFAGVASLMSQHHDAQIVTSPWWSRQQQRYFHSPPVAKSWQPGSQAGNYSHQHFEWTWNNPVVACLGIVTLLSFFVPGLFVLPLLFCLGPFGVVLVVPLVGYLLFAWMTQREDTLATTSAFSYFSHR